VAILLLFLSEEDAFWGLVYIVEKLMPSDYYGHQLTGAQVDQVRLFVASGSLPEIFVYYTHTEIIIFRSIPCILNNKCLLYANICTKKVV
jgi:hypothetical protein